MQSMATFAQPPAPRIARESGAMQGPHPARGGAGRLTRLRSAASARGASALDALLAAAQPQGATADALAERPRWLPRIEGRKAIALGAVGLAALAFVLTSGPGAELASAFDRAASADWRWAALGVVFEALAFAGYATLFWHIAGRSAPGLGLRGSTEISLAGAAA